MHNFIFGIPAYLPPELADVPGLGDWKPYKGSIQVAADCCGRVVWQGPAQQLHKVENPDIPIVCALCAVKMLKESGTTAVNVIQLTDKEQGE